MADFTAVPTVELLTRAAEAAGRAVAECEAEAPEDAEMLGVREMYRTLRGVGCQPGSARMLAASGPDHWRAVEATLRAMLDLHRVGVDEFAPQCRDCFEDFPCATLLALRSLAEQVLQHLGDTE